MKRIYFAQYFLDVPTEKNELRPHQLRNLKAEFGKTQLDYLAILMVLTNPKPLLRLSLWVNFWVKPYLAYSIFGAIYVWFCHHFLRKDVVVVSVSQRAIAEEVLELCAFLKNEEELSQIKPIDKIGFFQKLTDFGFDDITVYQFIESYRCFLIIQSDTGEAQKQEAIEELLSYFFTPRIMWFFGVRFRLFLLKNSFQQSRQAKVKNLDEGLKVLIYQYYVDNLAILPKIYKNFYAGGSSEKQRDIYTQYWSLKGLVQLRSPNGTLSDEVNMMKIRDLIETYETEIVQAKIKKEQYDSSAS